MTMPNQANLYCRLRQRFPADSARPFADDGRARYSYDEVERRSAQAANALVELGVEPGDRVLVQTDKSAAALFLYLGCLRAGAVYVPLNPAYTRAEVAYFIADAEPSLLVCRPSPSAGLAFDPQRVWQLDADGEGSWARRAAAQPESFSEPHRDGGDLAAMLYTSGTTGRSKGAMLSHDNLAANAFTLVEAWAFRGDDVLLHALPIFHTHGLFVASHCVLASGSQMIFQPRFDVERVIDALTRSTVLMGVPTFYTRLLASPRFDAGRCRNMRLFISGSAPLSAETHRQFAERSGHRILERYGMTETGMLTSNPYHGQRRPGSVGPALDDVRIRVCRPQGGEPLPPGEVGVVEVSGPNVFSGYWKLPDKTAAEFRDDGFFVTGDLGYLDRDGYLTIVGRDKDLIISGGFNVYPKEIESVLETRPEVAEVAVIGLPHADFGEAVTAVVALRPETAADEPALIAAAAERLAKYKCPKRVLFVDELPRNAMGKIQKNLLREQYRSLYRDGR